jgi:hypothetical protein
MNPIEVAAKFAAYTWFQNQRKSKSLSETEAFRFANHQHHLYLDVALANQGLGRLLMDVIAARQDASPGRKSTWEELPSSSSEACSARSSDSWMCSLR